MSKAPLVSVLVPIYNVAEYLDQCLSSLAAQTLKDAEFICINDGSTDNSREIIESYLTRDSRFRVIDKENSGYGASMNRGLKEATGKYVAILESDDFMAANGLELLVQRLEQTDADFVKANFHLYWSKPEAKNEFFAVVPENVVEKTVDPKDHPEIFYSKPSIWSAVYKRAFLEEQQINFLETPGASFQDTSFTFKVYAQAKKAAFVATPIVHYRQDNENSSVNSPAKVDAVFTEYAEISRWIDTHPDSRLHPIKTKMFFDVTLWNYNRVAPEFKLEVLQRAAAQFEAEQAAGHLDIRLFEPWKLEDLRALLIDPAAFHQQQGSSKNLTQRVLRAVSEHGPLFLVRAAARKAGHLVKTNLSR